MYFMWICPNCNMKNYEIGKRDIYLCRDGDCGKEFADKEILKIATASARISYSTNRIVVDRCPFCFHTHYHNLPVGEGTRMADCLKDEYLLVFDD